MKLLEKYLAPELGERDLSDVARRVGNAVMPHDPDEYIDIIDRCLFLPNTPTLANAGIGGKNLAACHVIEVGNSIKEIMEANALCASIFKTGGGVGINLSDLSRSGTPLRYSRGVASGPCSFMDTFNTLASVIMQGGLRRAAILALINAKHEDIMSYIMLKTIDGKYKHINMSVSLDDGPNNCDKDVWNAICTQANLNGEPGIVFLDLINADNPMVDEFGPIRSVNACGEVPMYNDGSCTLGSVNLARLVNRPGDYQQLAYITKLAARFLDRVIDVNYYPAPEIAESTRRTRDIGIGVMGFDTMLHKFGIAWNSEYARHLAQEISGVMRESAAEESERIANVTGEYYPGTGMRNRTLLSIAPTGHRALLAGVSHSIYPDYNASLDYTIEEHLLMVSAWQKNIDNSISYTLTRRSGEADKIFKMAYDMGIKTMSVYTAGSRENEPFTETDCKSGTCSL